MSKKPQDKGPYKHYKRPTTSRSQMHSQDKEKGKSGHPQLWAGLIIIAIILIALIPIVESKMHQQGNQNIAEKSVQTSKKKSRSSKPKSKKKSTKKKSATKSKKVNNVDNTQVQNNTTDNQTDSSSHSSTEKDFRADSNGNYTLQAGDTLSEIARANNTTVSELMRINDLSSQNSVNAGETIKVKDDGSHSKSSDDSDNNNNDSDSATTSSTNDTNNTTSTDTGDNAGNNDDTQN